MKRRKFKKIDKRYIYGLALSLIVLGLGFSIISISANKSLSLLRILRAAVVEIQLVISPMSPITGTIFPNSVTKGDTISLRISGDYFISGYDPVEKIILVPRGGGNTVYSARTRVKNENVLSASIDTTALPLGEYDLKVVNEFMGRDIVSTTYGSLSVVAKTESIEGASFPVVHVAMESALDHTVADTIAVASKEPESGTMALELPSNFFADDSKVLNLKVDTFDEEAFRASAGDSGDKMPTEMGGIGAIYDIKFTTTDNESITTTDKPIELDFYYNPSAMAAKGISLTTLKAYHWNEVSLQWEEEDSTVSLAENKVAAAVSNFSPYTVFGNYVCDDGLDNEGDGNIDYPRDPDCNSSFGGSEGLPPVPPSPSQFYGGGTVMNSRNLEIITARGSVMPSMGAQNPGALPKVSNKVSINSPSVSKGPSTIGNSLLNKESLPGGLITKNLQFGMKDDQVKLLQLQLIGAGYYTGPITGYFGDLTRKAVKAFQMKNGINQTGVVGPVTMSSLNSFNRAQVKVQPSQGSTSERFNLVGAESQPVKNPDNSAVSASRTNIKDTKGQLNWHSKEQAKRRSPAPAEVFVNVGQTFSKISNYVIGLWNNFWGR